MKFKIKLLFLICIADYMNIQLIVGDGDLVLIEGVLDTFHQRVIYRPVILVLAVAADGKFQRAVTEFLEPDSFRIALVIQHMIGVLDHLC